MFGNSRSVVSNQHQAHDQLEEILTRYQRSRYQRQPHSLSVELFENTLPSLLNASGQLILDAGCGTALSTELIAKEHPFDLVVGVDKSSHRLNRSTISGQSNLLLLKMDLVDFWLLSKQHKITYKKQFILYPNPWPKEKHLKRRWHAHPIFPSMIAIGGELELRTNWRIYAEEFSHAVQLLTGAKPCWQESDSGFDEIHSRFEQKYLASAQRLYRLTVPDCGERSKLSEL